MTTWDELVGLARERPRRRPRRTPDPACERKKAFRSRDEATSAIRRMRREYRMDVTSYQCPTCQQWHITSRR